MPERLDWKTFTAVLTCAPRDSAYARAKLGEESQWALGENLLARVSDQIEMLRWGLGGNKGARPKPIRRPGTRGESQHIGQGESWTHESLTEWIRLTENGG